MSKRMRPSKSEQSKSGLADGHIYGLVDDHTYGLADGHVIHVMSEAAADGRNYPINALIPQSIRGVADNVLIYGAESTSERYMLVFQNICVALAALLFLAGQFIKALDEYHTLTNGIAYILGSGAYAMELLVLTNSFKRKHHPRELFMPYVFGVLYIILGISYFVRAIG